MKIVQPVLAVERIVANGLRRQHCQALAAVGGGQRPGFTMLAAQPKSATAAQRLPQFVGTYLRIRTGANSPVRKHAVSSLRKAPRPLYKQRLVEGLVT